MIEAIVQIGNMIKNGILEQFDIEKGTNLICLNFDTEINEIEVKIDRELTSDFLVSTGYRGVKRGSGKEYSVIVFGDKKYLKYFGIGEPASTTKFSLLNICEEIKRGKDADKKELANKLDKIISQFYENKYGKYLLKDYEIITNKIKSISGNTPFYLQVCLDGIPLWKVYKHKISGKIIDSVKCSICSKRGVLKNFDTNYLKFLKFFGKDKLGFYPGTSLENQWKVLPLCPECAESIVLSDVYLKESKFNIKIAGNLNLLVLPNIPEWKSLSKEFIRRSFSLLTKATDMLTGWRELSQFDVYAEKIFETKDIKLHLVVNTYDGQTLKIYASLTNIPPSRIKSLALLLKDISLFISNFINISFSLKTLYNLLSGKSSVQSAKTPLIKEKFAEVFKNLILGNQFPDLILIKPGLELSKWQFENRDDLEWIKTIRIIEGFLLVKEFMKGIKFNLNGGKIMDNIFDEAQEYVNNLPIYQGKDGDIRKGLFFLGYIISQIAGKQREKGLGETILDKIQFRGMNKEHVLRLFNQVFEYMRIYDLQQFPENSKLMGEIASIFDRYLNKWNLSIEETVYFILSGYAFLVSRLIGRKKEIPKKEEEHE